MCRALLGELTLEEKASLVSGSGFWWTRQGRAAGDPVDHGERRAARAAQAGAAPPTTSASAGSVPATCFPTASALASSWDRDLVRQVGAAIGEEARAQDLAVVLGPGINIKRSPLCGRNFEYLSEDPFVAGELGAAMVDGIQSQGVGHLAQALRREQPGGTTGSGSAPTSTTGRCASSTWPGSSGWSATPQPWTVMCSYNRINGVYASQDPWLLTEVLRDEWGFDGLVMSDWGAVDDPTAAAARRARPGDAVHRRRQRPHDRRRGAGRRRSTRPRSTPPSRRLLQLIDRTLPGVEADDDRSTPTPTTRWPAGPRPTASCC